MCVCVCVSDSESNGLSHIITLTNGGTMLAFYSPFYEVIYTAIEIIEICNAFDLSRQWQSNKWCDI